MEKVMKYKGVVLYKNIPTGTPHDDFKYAVFLKNGWKIPINTQKEFRDSVNAVNPSKNEIGFVTLSFGVIDDKGMLQFLPETFSIENFRAFALANQI